MARLIDVEKAIIDFGFEWDDISPTREEFVEFLKRQPDAVVRCKECEHSEVSTLFGVTRRFCHMMQDAGYLADSLSVDDDYFCYGGVRRDDK